MSPRRAAPRNHDSCFHKLYNMSCAKYDELRERSGGKCEICGVAEEDTPFQRLYIDHDHRLGNGKNHVRGLVCPSCNSRLRYVDDGTRQPTVEQKQYLNNAWYFTAIPRHTLLSPVRSGPRVDVPAWSVTVPEPRCEELTVEAFEEAP